MIRSRERRDQRKLSIGKVKIATSHSLQLDNSLCSHYLCFSIHLQIYPFILSQCVHSDWPSAIALIFRPFVVIFVSPFDIQWHCSSDFKRIYKMTAETVIIRGDIGFILSAITICAEYLTWKYSRTPAVLGFSLQKALGASQQMCKLLL